MQVVEIDTTAPEHFASRYSASQESCPQARRGTCDALAKTGLPDQGACAASVVVIGPLGAEIAGWLSLALDAGVGVMRREAGAPCP
jgi:hypothetical protein